MKEYVCGFLFSNDKKRILLIGKERPDWQRGKYNGVGGSIEWGKDHSRREAMIREFKEECGVRVAKWNLFAQLDDLLGSSIYFYWAVGDVDACQATTDEKPAIFPVDALPENVIPNLRWLIPMALSFDHGEKAMNFVVKERQPRPTSPGPAHAGGIAGRRAHRGRGEMTEDKQDAMRLYGWLKTLLFTMAQYEAAKCEYEMYGTLDSYNDMREKYKSFEAARGEAENQLREMDRAAIADLRM